MAKSKAKKMREHLRRNGLRDAVLSRGAAPSFSTHERVTKTKKDRLERIKHKKRNPHDHRSDGGDSFFLPESRSLSMISLSCFLFSFIQSTKSSQ